MDDTDWVVDLKTLQGNKPDLQVFDPCRESSPSGTTSPSGSCQKNFDIDGCTPISSINVPRTRSKEELGDGRSVRTYKVRSDNAALVWAFQPSDGESPLRGVGFPR